MLLLRLVTRVMPRAAVLRCPQACQLLSQMSRVPGLSCSGATLAAALRLALRGVGASACSLTDVRALTRAVPLLGGRLDAALWALFRTQLRMRRPAAAATLGSGAAPAAALPAPGGSDGVPASGTVAQPVQGMDVRRLALVAYVLNRMWPKPWTGAAAAAAAAARQARQRGRRAPAAAEAAEAAARVAGQAAEVAQWWEALLGACLLPQLLAGASPRVADPSEQEPAGAGDPGDAEEREEEEEAVVEGGGRLSPATVVLVLHTCARMGVSPRGLVEAAYAWLAPRVRALPVPALVQLAQAAGALGVRHGGVLGALREVALGHAEGFGRMAPGQAPVPRCGNSWRGPPHTPFAPVRHGACRGRQRPRCVSAQLVRAPAVHAGRRPCLWPGAWLGRATLAPGWWTCWCATTCSSTQRRAMATPTPRALTVRTARAKAARPPPRPPRRRWRSSQTTRWPCSCGAPPPSPSAPPPRRPMPLPPPRAPAPPSGAKTGPPPPQPHPPPPLDGGHPATTRLPPLPRRRPAPAARNSSSSSSSSRAARRQDPLGAPPPSTRRWRRAARSTS